MYREFTFNSETGATPLRNFHPMLGQGVLVRRRTEQTREFEEEVIGDRDTRQRVDTIRMPFRWICSLKVRFRDPDSFDAVDFDAGSGLLMVPDTF